MMGSAARPGPQRTGGAAQARRAMQQTIAALSRASAAVGERVRSWKRLGSRRNAVALQNLTPDAKNAPRSRSGSAERAFCNSASGGTLEFARSAWDCESQHITSRATVRRAMEPSARQEEASPVLCDEDACAVAEAVLAAAGAEREANCFQAAAVASPTPEKRRRPEDELASPERTAALDAAAADLLTMSSGSASGGKRRRARSRRVGRDGSGRDMAATCRRLDEMERAFAAPKASDT